MELTAEQQQQVAAWFAAGASLDEIQKRLKSDFGLHVTYLDVRLLVADLPQPVEETPASPDGQALPGQKDDAPGGRPSSAAAAPDAPASPDGQALPGQNAQSGQNAQPGQFAVESDTLTIPGTLASGDVTFSDGQKGKWYVDQTGRLGLGGDLPPGYRPSPADAALFQSRLMEILQAKGLY